METESARILILHDSLFVTPAPVQFQLHRSHFFYFPMQLPFHLPPVHQIGLLLFSCSTCVKEMQFRLCVETGTQQQRDITAGSSDPVIGQEGTGPSSPHRTLCFGIKGTYGGPVRPFPVSESFRSAKRS